MSDSPSGVAGPPEQAGSFRGQGHTEDPRIEAAAKVLYADNRSQYDSPEFEWLHPDMQSRYRAVVAKVIATADQFDPRVAQLAEARVKVAEMRALHDVAPFDDERYYDDCQSEGCADEGECNGHNVQVCKHCAWYDENGETIGVEWPCPDSKSLDALAALVGSEQQ